LEIITSRQNPAVKLVRQLQEKKFRINNSLFLMEGFRPLQELLKSDSPIEIFFYSPGITEPGQASIISSISQRANKTIVVSDEIMDYISPAKTSQKALAALPVKPWDLKETIEAGRYFLALYKISEPGNLGTVIRSARAFDCGGIFLIGDCVDQYHPRAVRSSAGYVLSIPVFHFNDFSEFEAALPQKHFYYAAFSPGASASFEPGQIEKKKKNVFILGGEAGGLDKEIENKADGAFRIPMSVDVESLNLAAAASIVMEKEYGSTKS
jgi:RNA methyltransferase, TrmH family